MADINLKTETPDTTLPTTGFLFGADSQAAASPSVYTTQAVATTLLGSTTLSGATITADAPVLNMSQTWNNAAVTFTGLKYNATDTASNAASLLMDLQTGGTSRFRVTKGGFIEVPSATGAFGDSVGVSFRLNVSGLGFGSSQVVGWSTGNVQALDLILTRRAAANLRLGAADAAAPVAQTLSVQSVVTGTSNTAGANLTITGSQGTGTGAGGSIIFQVAPAGSSGSAQNALATALTIGSDRVVTVAANASSLAQIAMADRGTILSIYTAAFGTQPLLVSAPGGIAIYNNTGTYQLGALQDVVLARDAANTLALRNGANAQAFRVYNTYTDATTFERANIFWDSNILKIGTEKGSVGGTARALQFQTDGTTRLTIDTNGYALFGGQTASINVAGSLPSLLQIADNSSTLRAAMFAKYRVSTLGPTIVLAKSRSATIGTGSPVLSGDDLGTLSFQGVGQANFEIAASIIVQADGTPSSTSMPGRMIFSTTASGSTTATERLRIDAAGDFTVADASDVILGTTTGTKIGTGTTQKLGFWNAAPVVQPTAVADATDAATVITQLNALLAHMRTIGLIAT